MIGTTLGQHRIVEKTGESGMREVYRAHDDPDFVGARKQVR